ncbi:MAG: lysophospholipid acyltransferase family protein [Bacteroidota bacterium]
MKQLFIQIFYFLIVRPWLSLIIGVRFENKAVLNEARRYIIVANHNSHFDMVSILAAVPIRKLKHTYAVAAADYFTKTPFRDWGMRTFFNAILIRRQKEAGQPSAIEQLDGHLKDGRSLIMFPEGSRGEPGVMADFKKGVAILLKNHPSIPFVPVYLDGFGRVLPKNSNLIVPLVCKVRFGKPIYPETEDIDEILEQVKTAILDLREKDERDRNRFRFD